MKTKRMISIMVLGMVSVCLLAQDSTQVVITHVEGQPFLAFLKQNAWQLAFLVFMCVETWLGQTGKVKDGSVVALIINWIGKFLGKQVIKDKALNAKLLMAKREAKMTAEKRRQFPKLPKMIIIGLVLSTGSLLAQSPWDGFWKPVDKNMFMYGASDQLEMKSSEWLFRPEVQISAMKFTPSEDKSKVFDVSSFTSAGVGVGYQHYVESNGEPYNNYGFNALLLFTAVPTESVPAGISIAGTVNALKFVSVGVGYDFGVKNYFLLTGVALTF